MKKINIFFDMDGVLAEYHPETYLRMYEKNFFKNRPLVKRIGNLYKELLYLTKTNKNISVHILSKVIDSKYIIPEKEYWLDKYFGDVYEDTPERNRIFFVPIEESKIEYIKNQDIELKNSLNILLDDYTENLNEWIKEGANFKGIKIKNKINGTKGSWFKRKLPEISIKDSLGVSLSKIGKLIKET